jgi:hypothetical protein
MNTVWYIQEYNSRQYTQDLIYAVQELGYELFVDKYIPFETEHDLSFLPTDKPVIFHGAISCALNVQERKLPYYPFCWFDANKLLCKSYYAHWGGMTVQEPYGLYPLGDLKRLAPWLFKVYGRKKYDEGEPQIFLRPDTNDKVFVGEVVSESRFESFMNWDYIKKEMGDALVIVSRPTKILKEWRLIIAEGKTVTGSQYSELGMLDVQEGYPPEAAELAEKAFDIWSPHPVLCIDIANTENGFKIMECGSVNCAGFYKCNIRKIVKAMSQSAEKAYLSHTASQK